MIILLIPLVISNIQDINKQREETLTKLYNCDNIDTITQEKENKDLEFIESERKFNKSMKMYNYINTLIVIVLYLYVIVQLINTFYYQEHLSYILKELRKIF